MVSSCLDFIVTVAGLLEYWSGRWDMLNRSKGILALFSSIGGIVRLHLSPLTGEVAHILFNKKVRRYILVLGEL